MEEPQASCLQAPNSDASQSELACVINGGVDNAGPSRCPTASANTVASSDYAVCVMPFPDSST
jgi:hypothetical protein